MGRAVERTLADAAKVLRERRRQQQRETTRIKRQGGKPRKTSIDELVDPFLAQHGSYEEGKVVDLTGELGGRRMSIVKVMMNRGGTAVDRWIANDKAGLFEEPQRRAIRYTQNLWERAQEGGVRAVDTTADVVDGIDGWSQQEAIVELKKLQARVPRQYWDVYENVCRWDEEAGVAGSRLASNGRSAIDAAKTTVAFTASLIAMWRRL